MTVEGVVVDVCRGMHRVEVRVPGPNGTTRTITVLAKRSGWLDMHRMKCVPGDVVEVEICEYDTGRGRIVHRGKRAA